MRNTLPKQDGFSSFQVKVHRVPLRPAWVNGCTYKKPEDLLPFWRYILRFAIILKQPSKNLRNPASLRGTMPVNLWGWFSQQAADGGPCPPTTKSTIYKIYEHLLKFAFAGWGREVLPQPSFSIQFPDLCLAEEWLRNGRFDGPTLLKTPWRMVVGRRSFLGKGALGVNSLLVLGRVNLPHISARWDPTIVINEVMTRINGRINGQLGLTLLIGVLFQSIYNDRRGPPCLNFKPPSFGSSWNLKSESSSESNNPFRLPICIGVVFFAAHLKPHPRQNAQHIFHHMSGWIHQKSLKLPKLVWGNFPRISTSASQTLNAIMVYVPIFTPKNYRKWLGIVRIPWMFSRCLVLEGRFKPWTFRTWNLTSNV